MSPEGGVYTATESIPTEHHQKGFIQDSMTSSLAHLRNILDPVTDDPVAILDSVTDDSVAIPDPITNNFVAIPDQQKIYPIKLSPHTADFQCHAEAPPSTSRASSPINENSYPDKTSFGPQGRAAQPADIGFKLRSSPSPEGASVAVSPGVADDKVEETMGIGYVVCKCGPDILNGNGKSIPFSLDQGGALCTDLVAHEGIEDNVAESWVTGKTAVVPLRGVFNVVSIGNRPLPM